MAAAAAATAATTATAQAQQVSEPITQPGQFSLMAPGGIAVPSSASSFASALASGAPVPTNAVTNKPGVASSSLYQACLMLSNRLRLVPGFTHFLDQVDDMEFKPDAVVPDTGLSFDPVSRLWRCLRLGSSLCVLLNGLNPSKPLPVNYDASLENLNQCKASVYRFLLACRNELKMDDDELFTITQLYNNDTNGFIKVTKTVSLVVDKLGEFGLLDQPIIKDTDNSVEESDPLSKAAKVIHELLETERKYVQHMEILQKFMDELQVQEIITADTIHHLFSNLHNLLDFQQRLLIGIESNAARPLLEQRIGALFESLEEGFSVYEPFCANYPYALEIVQAEHAKLCKLSHIVDPNYELPSLLIKPIQRICKYPLLLKELLKSIEPDDALHAEVERGMESVKRVADRVNETRRHQENEQAVKELERRVVDWKGHNVGNFGALLLEDVLPVIKGDMEREYHVYLFERILLCCKEVNSSKKSTRTMSISRKQKARASLTLKGRIYISNVTNFVASNATGIYILRIYWRGDVDQEYFTIKFRNDESLQQWHNVLSKLHHEVQTNRLSGLVRHTLEGQSQTPTLSANFRGMFKNMESDDDQTTTYDEEERTPERVSLERNPSQASTRSISYRPGPTPLLSRERSSSSPNFHVTSPVTGLSRQIVHPPLPEVPVPQTSSHPVFLNMDRSTNVKIKVNYFEDIFVIMVPQDLTYSKLLERVERKVRLCGGDAAAKKPLRMRYVDEDDDHITINTDEDVQMALEASGNYTSESRTGAAPTLILYVS